jgi:hypothetical protein
LKSARTVPLFDSRKWSVVHWRVLQRGVCSALHLARYRASFISSFCAVPPCFFFAFLHTYRYCPIFTRLPSVLALALVMNAKACYLCWMSGAEKGDGASPAFWNRFLTSNRAQQILLAPETTAASAFFVRVDTCGGNSVHGISSLPRANGLGASRP